MVANTGGLNTVSRRKKNSSLSVTYPEVTLSEAREKRQDARKLLREGTDPAAKKQEGKRLAVFNAANTFETVTKEWHEANKAKWTPEHGEKILRRLELHIFPELGNRPLKEIKAIELLDALRKVEKRKATHLSRRLLQLCRAVFRYGIVTQRIEYNPAADLQGALAAHKEEHYPTLQAKELPQFLQRLEDVETTAQNKLAIKLLMHTFMRQGELRRTKWTDIDFEAKEWHIPAENTKMRDAHIVPLARQTIDLLKDLQAVTGESPYLLPSQHRQKNPIMSENTINMVLAKMGYKGKLVGHGFRALASTILNEQGYRPDVIERQLAHAERNKVRAAYNRAEYLPERRDMMQHWADYLDGTANKGTVIMGNFANKKRI
jgi:integrase